MHPILSSWKWYIYMRTNVQTNTKNYYLSFQHLNFISFEFICVKFHLRCKMQKTCFNFKRKTIKKDCNSQFTNKYTLCAHSVHCEHADCCVCCVLCTIYNAIKIQLSLFTKWKWMCMCAACSCTRTSDQNYKGEQFLLSS